MEIYGPASVHGPHGVKPPHGQRAAQAPAATQVQSTEDQLDLSEAGQIAARLSEATNVRQDRVAEIRAELAAGTYETPQKLALALDRMIDQVG